MAFSGKYSNRRLKGRGCLQLQCEKNSLFSPLIMSRLPWSISAACSQAAGGMEGHVTVFFPALSGCLGDGEAGFVHGWVLHARLCSAVGARSLCAGVLWLVSSEGDHMPWPNQGALVQMLPVKGNVQKCSSQKQMNPFLSELFWKRKK